MPTRVNIQLWTVDRRDNGTGVPVAYLTSTSKPGHFGLVGMRERAAGIGATFTCTNQLLAGTCVQLHLVPCRAYG